MQFKVPDDDQTYDLVTKHMFAEGEAFEKFVGMTMARVDSLDPEDRPLKAMRAAVWISMKRKNPTLTFAELEDMEYDAIEWIAENDEEREALGEGGAPELGPTNPATDPVANEGTTQEPSLESV